MALEQKPVGPTPMERRDENIRERSKNGNRIVTDSGIVADVIDRGLELNLFISRQDKRDTDKISVDMPVDEAIQVAELILKHARKLILKHASKDVD